MRKTLFLLAFLAILSISGCSHPSAAREPTGDALRDLNEGIKYAKSSLPLMRLACSRIHHEDERQECISLTDRIEKAIPKAQDIIAQAEACVGQSDETECISLAVEAANVVLRELQGQSVTQVQEEPKP